jgi:hypothetical protein
VELAICRGYLLLNELVFDANCKLLNIAQNLEPKLERLQRWCVHEYHRREEHPVALLDMPSANPVYTRIFIAEEFLNGRAGRIRFLPNDVGPIP